MPPATQPQRRRRSSADERSAAILATARRLFSAHGIHAVGMDRLIAETGLGKMSVYRVFPTKDDLVGAYLEQLADEIMAAIDGDIQRSHGDPRVALHAILDAIECDLRRDGFRGCPFGNAAGEFEGADHPARLMASSYRARLLERLTGLAVELDPDGGRLLGRRLAVLVDGAYLSAAHLGWQGPASEGIAMARELVGAGATD